MGQLYVARILLLSCGVVVGMALGFLGFALFLLGVEGTQDVEGTAPSLTLKLARLSPGAFVIICSAVLVGVCVTRPLPFNYGSSGRPADPRLKDAPPPSVDTKQVRDLLDGLDASDVPRNEAAQPQRPENTP